MNIFISYCSKDRAIVKRIGSDLKSHNFKIWMDEDNIPYGGNIVEHIQNGLDQCNVLIIFLSEHAVLSRWVQTEWQTFFIDRENTRIVVLPIILSSCKVPKFLLNIRSINFTDKQNYEGNLSTLLQALNELNLDDDGSYLPVPISINNANYSIVEYTKEILEELEEECISLPVHKRLMIIDTLKKIPRSGKLVRLSNFKPTLRIRTIHDHILSVAHSADCLLPHIRHGLTAAQFAEIARCIAFHELEEVVLGDIPIYTSLSSQKRIKSRIYAEERIRTVEPAKRRKIASDFVWMFLNEKNRKSFEIVNNILDDIKSPIRILFKVFDKIDPIIAVWRYLYTYRTQLGPNPKQFNHCMKDFFENPDVKNFIISNKVDEKILDLVNHLQDRTNAWNYYENPDRMNKKLGGLFSLPKNVVINLIEGFPLFPV